MSITKAQIKATTKYVKNNYDETKIRLPKGSKEFITEKSKSLNLSVNSYIIKLIEEDLGKSL
jgi:hypothetical protein